MVAATDADFALPLDDGRLLSETNASAGNASEEEIVFTSDVDNLCGHFRRPCELMAGIPNGPDIWMASEFRFERNRTYVYRERGFFNHSACVRGDTWLTMTYHGTWRGQGLSKYKPGETLVTVDIVSVWLKLWHEEVCVRDLTDGSIDCLDTLAAVRMLCPCNGWDWHLLKGMKFRERNVGMFCRPFEQCPLIHELYLQQTHYISFTAAREKGCFSKPSTSRAEGWELPEDDGCFDKVAAMTCTPPRAAATRRADDSSLALALLSAALLTMWLAA